MCGRHYENLRLRGDAVPQRDRPVWDRLVEIGWTQVGDCLEWNGARHEHGYGLYDHQRVHRLVFEHYDGPLEPGEVVRHQCDNPPCGRRDHLVRGSQPDNVADMVERRRHWRHDRLTCDAGHDIMAPGASHPYVDGSRCRACRSERSRRYSKAERGPRP